MRRGIIMLLASALVIAPAAHAQSEPVADKGDQFAPRRPAPSRSSASGTGPTPCRRQRLHRFDLNLPVRDGYVPVDRTGLKRVQDMSVPTHQEAHIHHAHWRGSTPATTTTTTHTASRSGYGAPATRRRGPTRGGRRRPIRKARSTAVRQVRVGSSRSSTWSTTRRRSRWTPGWCSTSSSCAGRKRQLEEKTGRDHREPDRSDLRPHFRRLAEPVGRRHLGYGAGRQGGRRSSGRRRSNGTMIGVGGHLHPGGISVTLENLGSEENPCATTRGSCYGARRSPFGAGQSPRAAVSGLPDDGLAPTSGARRSGRATCCGSTASTRTGSTPGTTRCRTSGCSSTRSRSRAGLARRTRVGRAKRQEAGRPPARAP